MPGDVHELTRLASSPGGFHVQRLRVRINCTQLSLQGYHAINPVLLHLLGEFSVVAHVVRTTSLIKPDVRVVKIEPLQQAIVSTPRRGLLSE